MNIQIDPRIASQISTYNQKQDPALSKNHAKLRESTREVEAMYIFEMYKSMRKNVNENGLIKKTQSTQMFQEMLDMEMARKTAQGKGMGLGEAMFNQLKDHTKP